MNNEKIVARNRFSFGIGTIGRDMTYALVSMFLIFYLTEVVKLSDQMLLWVTGILVFARVFDALNDPIMGTIVDNTNTKWGQFKPWIAVGALLSGVFTILLFTDFRLKGAAYIVSFAAIYLFWGISYTINDISYWSMMPSLSNSQKDREKIGAFARICANLGLFSVVAGIESITEALSNALGSMKLAYMAFAIIIVCILWAGQCVTLLGVKEPSRDNKKNEHTNLKGMAHAILHNDQLLFTAISMGLFMIGYTTTTSFGLYFFKYAFKDEKMYTYFALVLGVSQIFALTIFPFFSNHFTRKQIYTSATILVFLGYVVFFFAPMDMLIIGIAGVLLFVGQAFIQLLMLVFLADTIEYGELKLGKRNASVSFSIQPFIYKLGGAIASGILGVTLVITKINGAKTPDDVTAAGLFIMKFSMLVLPLLFILLGYYVYLKKYKIDKAMYEDILVQLNKKKGELSHL